MVELTEGAPGGANVRREERTTDLAPEEGEGEATGTQGKAPPIPAQAHVSRRRTTASGSESARKRRGEGPRGASDPRRIHSFHVARLDRGTNVPVVFGSFARRRKQNGLV